MKVEGVVTAWNGMLCLELTADSGGTYRPTNFESVKPPLWGFFTGVLSKLIVRLKVASNLY